MDCEQLKQRGIGLLLAFFMALGPMIAMVEGQGPTFGDSPLILGFGSPKQFPVPPSHERAPLTNDVQSVASANNGFAFDLFGKLRADKPVDENMLVSPLSVSTALAMTYAGARGRTAEQMAEVLHLDSMGQAAHGGYGDWIGDLNTERAGYVLNVANRLFGEQTMEFKQPFLDVMSESYGAPLEPMDFTHAPDQSRESINAWVEDNTNDRIKDLLPKGSIQNSTRLVLANAIYFNGDWKRPFDKDWTEDKLFYKSDGSTMLAPTMQQVVHFAYGKFEGYQMLEMPYAGDDLSMVVLLPDEVDGLAVLEESLTAEQLQQDLDALRYREVALEFPKFTFGDRTQLTDALVELGMIDAFAGGDFGGMADEALKLSSVFHQTFIDVSETGTEAAAATAVGIGTSDAISEPTPPIPFQADHPFLFAIRDTHTGGVMFLGRMAEPTPAAQAAAVVPEPNCGLLLLVAAGGLRAVLRARGT